MERLLTAPSHRAFAGFVCLVGLSQIVLGVLWIPLLPVWTGYLPVPGIMLVHLGGLTKLTLGGWLWFRDLERFGALGLLVFCTFSYSAHPTDAILKSLCMLGALAILANFKKKTPATSSQRQYI